MTITTTLSSGLFKPETIHFPELTESIITAKVTGGEEPVIALVYIPDGTNTTYSMFSVKTPKNIINLNPGLNVFHFTTKDIADENGLGNFNLVAKDGSSVSGKGIKAGFIKYTNVINH